MVCLGPILAPAGAVCIQKSEGPHITDLFETVENSSIRVGWLTLGLLLIVDLRPLTFVAVLGLGVEGGRGTGVE